MYKKTSEELKHYRPSYMDYEDIEDEIMFHEMMYDEDYSDNGKETEYSTFLYPDPYDSDPTDMIYVGEDGDILDDL